MTFWLTQLKTSERGVSVMANNTEKIQTKIAKLIHLINQQSYFVDSLIKFHIAKDYVKTKYIRERILRPIDQEIKKEANESI